MDLWLDAWLKGTTSLVVAVTNLVAAVAALTTALLKAWRQLGGDKRTVAGLLRQLLRRPNLKSPWFVVGVTLLAVAVAILAVRRPMGPRERLLSSAWDAVNDEDWPAALMLASKCVDDFGPQGEVEQEELGKKQEPEPPTGELPDSERRATFARGLLNDVAACWFIKGQSAEKLGRRPDARNAYESAARLRHARVYDPDDRIFWSPATAASARLRTLQ